MLIKPTRKQILTAAALKARAVIEAQIDEKRTQIVKLHKADQDRRNNAKQEFVDKVAAKYQPAVDEIKEILVKYGLTSDRVSFSSNLPSDDRGHATWTVTNVALNVYASAKLARAMSAQIPQEQHNEEVSEIQAEINELNDKRSKIDPESAIFGVIAANLNGELSAALDTLTKGLAKAEVEISPTEAALANDHDFRHGYHRRY